jgi:predicted Zn-dependent protease
MPAEQITGFVRRRIKGPARKAPLIVVTDLEITPPEGWSYVIWWSDEKGGQVVAVPPTDPGFWGTKDEDRLLTIKHRVRTAVLSIAGELLGLERCSNDRCFLYEDVDSASTLDSMMWLGPEHGLAKLQGRGFERNRNEMTKVQEVVQLATPETAA